ncbi:MAG: DEAD/DEAH box helicase [Pleomorphochaeta sp.]
MKNILQKLADKTNNDEYLKKLIYKIEKNYSLRIINNNSKNTLTENELNNLLRFSDILCRSNNPKHRNLSLKIISLILEFNEFKNSKYVKAIATNTLIKLGNFPSLNIISKNENYLNIEEIKIDFLLKSIAHQSPLGKTFTDGQYKVFDELTKNNHFSFSGSTSFGKSYIFEAFTKYLIKNHNCSDNIAFIVPTKALINQVITSLNAIISENPYKIISTPKIPKIYLNENTKYIFVFTAERLISYFLDSHNPKIDYLFVDEAHKLIKRKDTRTPLLYHALVMAKRKSVNIYFASPNIPNSEIFLKLINNSIEENLSIIDSPVTQNRFFIDSINNKSYMISEYGEDILFPKLPFESNQINNLKLILENYSGNRQSIIYCNTVEKTIQTAIKLANKYPNKKDEKLQELINLINEKVHNQYFLKKCLEKGIAFHFGGIPEEIKFQIEKRYKEGLIKYLFCTSTLLEGVNLPAKNIFILSENIGSSKMDSIDFWNLAGRAGRLSKDLSGNIFCVNLFNQRGYWQKENKIEILRNKKIEKKEPQLLSNRNDNLYINIANYYENKGYTNSSFSQEQKKLIEMYGNILIFHDSIDSDSILKDKFIDSKNQSLSVLKKTRKALKIPSEILANSVDINFKNQNTIFINKTPSFPRNTTYQDCLTLLEILYEQYNWDQTESKGRKPMIKNRSQLKYYATVMESWINSKPLKVLIQKSINYFYNNGNPQDIYIRQDDGIERPEKFNIKDEYHINKVINDVVNTIENILRFKIKNYTSNYQLLLKAKNQEVKLDWESFIEYGTTDNRIIEIQDLGFPRNIAIFLKKHYFYTFVKKNGIVVDINKSLLKENFDINKYLNEYEEISYYLDW